MFNKYLVKAAATLALAHLFVFIYIVDKTENSLVSDRSDVYLLTRSTPAYHADATFMQLDPPLRHLSYRNATETAWAAYERLKLQYGDHMDEAPLLVYYVRGPRSERFARQELDRLPPHDFTLLTTGSTTEMPHSQMTKDSIKRVLGHPNLVHWYMDNYVDTGLDPDSKLHGIPIGLDFLTMAKKQSAVPHLVYGVNLNSIIRPTFWYQPPSRQKQQEAELMALRKNLLPTTHRIVGIFCDYQWNPDPAGKRNEAYQALQDSDARIDYLPGRIRRDELWEKKAQYAFDVSPPGFGWDCYRTWEDLALGIIPIVPASPIESIYEGFPIVVVQSWKEVTQANLEKWLQKYGDILHNEEYQERISTEFWAKRFRER